MKTSDWPLQDHEQLLWQGVPAPRCYIFRHWLQALLGTLLFLASSFWLMVGVQLVRAENHSYWLLSIPVLLVVGSFMVGPGRILLARLRWEKIAYALTDQRLLVRNRLLSGKISVYPLNEFCGCRRKRYGKNLLSLRLSFSDRPSVILECLEHPELLLRHLQE
jgi:hypothetical protein